MAVLVPQVLLEFFAAITNPKRVGNPLPPAVAWEQVRALRGSMPVLDVPAATPDILGRLALESSATGGRVLDFFLIAQMHEHRVSTICTYNLSDFSGIAGIEAITPEKLLARTGGNVADS
jgi:predicted nucleic acid-binding protein